jgi:hypothetical protein
MVQCYGAGGLLREPVRPPYRWPTITAPGRSQHQELRGAPARKAAHGQHAAILSLGTRSAKVLCSVPYASCGGHLTSQTCCADCVMRCAVCAVRRAAPEIHLAINGRIDERGSDFRAGAAERARGRRCRRARSGVRFRRATCARRRAPDLPCMCGCSSRLRASARQPPPPPVEEQGTNVRTERPLVNCRSGLRQARRSERSSASASAAAHV